MTPPTSGSGKASVLASSVAITCPAQGTPVPAMFSASGTYTVSLAGGVALADGLVVKCRVAYFDQTGAVKSQCRVCVLQPPNWCCRSDVSPDPPAGNAA